MDRSEYLELCRQCARLPDGVQNIKKNVPDPLRVIHAGIEYYPVSYELAFDKDGKPTHHVILHDLKANSTIKCDLSKIDRKVKIQEEE